MKMYTEDTNIFETKTGALNLAPLKISGQYKIVVKQNGDLYFDDYNNKQVLINKSQRFLPQLANFLRVKSSISNYSKLRYGGFSKSTQLSYHAPIYIGKDNLIPDYFIINNIGYGNKNDYNDLNDDINIGNISSLKKIIKLKDVGLHRIFNEIFELNQYRYPFYSDFQNHKIILYGYDYLKTTYTRKEISLLNYASNQTYFGAVNNYILNLFNQNNIIFPRFINIEFEFNDDINPNNLFGNYYGFYSFENQINSSEFTKLKSENKLGIFTVENKDVNYNIRQVQTWTNNTSLYKNLLFNVNSLDTQNKLPLARLKFNYLFDSDSIKIYDEFDNIYFEYIVTQKDIKNSFRETLIEVSKNITKISENQINCYLSNLQNVLIFEINSNVKNLVIKSSEQLNQYQFIDIFNTDLNPKFNNSLEEPTKLYFKEIGDFDIILNDIFETNNISNISGEYLKFNNYEQYYKINEFFIYNGLLVCNLNTNDENILTYRNDNLLIQIYNELETKLFYHNPIPFLNYINEDKIIESNEQFNKDEYISELETKFDSPEFQLALSSFSKFKFYDNKQFTNNFEASDILYNSYPNVNNTQVLNMKFGSYGFTSFITPNLFNFDLDFYDTNSNVVFEQEDLDKIRFHWFLIKSETPDYLNKKEYHLSSLRYFTDKPKLTSRLVDTGTHCETIFLGVKYTLPRKYDNYLFSVYLDFNNIPEDNITDDDTFDISSYNFEVDNTNKTIYLVINKYLDFIDLLRGGKLSNKPFIDLSFLYTVRQSYNTKSNLVTTFKSGGLLISDTTIPVMFNGNVVPNNNWRIQHNGKWYICIKRSTIVNTSLLKDLFPQDGDIVFYVYSKYQGITYQSMSVKLVGIQYVGDEYVWCEDIIIKFFDTKKLLINEYENLDENKLYQLTNDIDFHNNPNFIQINDSNITDSNDDITNITFYSGNDQKIFKILNSKKEFSFKKNYIEKIRKIEYNLNGEKIINDSIFYFPEFSGDLTEWNNIKFDLDNTSNYQVITLFDRNQLWYLIKNIVATDLRFKHNTETQTIKIINELLLSNLYEYSNFNSILIKNSNEYVKLQVVPNDFNVVIWNIKDIDNTIKTKVCKINRYSGPNIPIIDEVKNLSEFQVLKHNENQIINIFDKNYGNIKTDQISSSFFNIGNKIGLNNYHTKLIEETTNQNDIVSQITNYDINAIGLWDEIEGNVISSLFIKNDDITTTIKNSKQNKYNIFDLFKTNNNEILINQYILEQLLFSNLFPDKNKKYISKFNYNLDEYIYNTGINWLLNNFYYLSEIQDKDNKKVNFEYDNINKQVIIDINNYQPNGNYLLIWKRK